MNVFAYCANSFRESVHQAAGVEPLCSPPVTWQSFSHTLLQADLVYLKLHGSRYLVQWYGEHELIALTRTQILAADLSQTVLFIANCHSFHVMKGRTILSPMLKACLQAGARAVICGPGQTRARARAVDGCDLLGRHVRRFLTMRLPPTIAFRLARALLALSSRQDIVTADSLAFRIFRQGESYD